MGKLVWRGAEVLRQAETLMGEALGSVALEIESEAKRELYPGHGVDTGTLQRSIHVATPGYNWAGDNVKPSERSPERGGRRVNGLVLIVGSGMDYALAVHQGSGNRDGYHFLTNASDRVMPRALRIIQNYLARVK